MAYKNPESKREGCYYPNCDGYLAVPFCCHDPRALPELKARLAQLETPKREWVGLTSEQLATIVVQHAGFPTKQAEAINAKLKELNT